jgi:hypothetical protein
MFWRHIDDILALVLVVGMIILISCHIDSQAWGILGMAAAWIFRSGLETKRKGG